MQPAPGLSCGHEPASPGQDSAGSQVSGFPGLQIVVEARNPSAGQAVPLPVQLSATSHKPFAARHSVVAAANPSAGQAAPLPVQLSSTSHKPFAARHSVVAAANPSARQATSLPVQLSATSHKPFAARHSVVADRRSCPQAFAAHERDPQSPSAPEQVAGRRHSTRR